MDNFMYIQKLGVWDERKKHFVTKKKQLFFTMLSFYYFCNIFPARSLFTQKKLAKKTFAEKVLLFGAMEKTFVP